MIKQMCKSLGKMLLLLAAGMAVGTVLLCLAFLIPREPVRRHVVESAEVFEIEGAYPSLDGGNARIEDNYTDALMLLTAAYGKTEAGILEQALQAYHPEYAQCSMEQALILYARNEDGAAIQPYSRYWHGYLVFLRPFLWAAGYLNFRGIAPFCMAAVVIAVTVMMIRRERKRLVIPYLIALCFLRPDAIAYSLQYSSVFYITNLALLAGLVWEKRLLLNQYWYYFLVVGMITSYMDLLTYPIVTLGFPMALFLTVRDAESKRSGKACWKDSVIRVAIGSLSWAVGYFGMWAGKWLTASILLRQNVFRDAFYAIGNRVSRDYAGRGSSRLDVIMRNLIFGFQEILPFTVIVAGIVIAFFLLNLYYDWKRALNMAAPYLLVALMPFAWYAVLGNHSIIHSFFTYRSLAVAVLAVCCVGALPDMKRKK